MIASIHINMPAHSWCLLIVIDLNVDDAQIQFALFSFVSPVSWPIRGHFEHNHWRSYIPLPPVHGDGPGITSALLIHGSGGSSGERKQFFVLPQSASLQLVSPSRRRKVHQQELEHHRAKAKGTKAHCGVGIVKNGHLQGIAADLFRMCISSWLK